MLWADSEYSRDDRIDIETLLLSRVDDILKGLKEVGHYEEIISFDTRMCTNPCRNCKYGMLRKH